MILQTIGLHFEYRQFHHDTELVRNWMKALEQRIGPGISQRERTDIYFHTDSDEMGVKLASRGRITPEVKVRVAVDESAFGAEAFEKRVGSHAKETLDEFVDAKRFTIKKERKLFRLGAVTIFVSERSKS